MKRVELSKRTLLLMEEVLRPEHPDTLSSMNSTAMFLKQSGQVKEAAEIYEKIVAIRKKLLGADHPDTLTTCNNLGLAYLDLGRAGDAVLLLEEVYGHAKSKLEPDHPHNLPHSKQPGARIPDFRPISRCSATFRTGVYSVEG